MSSRMFGLLSAILLAVAPLSPALADDRFDVGAGGYGVMSGVDGLGAVIAGLQKAGVLQVSESKVRYC